MQHKFQYHRSSVKPLPQVHILVATRQSVAIASGNFIAAEKPTTGSARIVTEGGHHYLELDDAFSTSNQEPDLHVLLDTSGIHSPINTSGTGANLINSATSLSF